MAGLETETDLPLCWGYAVSFGNPSMISTRVKKLVGSSSPDHRPPWHGHSRGTMETTVAAAVKEQPDLERKRPHLTVTPSNDEWPWKWHRDSFPSTRQQPDSHLGTSCFSCRQNLPAGSKCRCGSLTSHVALELLQHCSGTSPRKRQTQHRQWLVNLCLCNTKNEPMIAWDSPSKSLARGTFGESC